MADLDFDSLYAEVVKPTAKKPTEAKPAEAKPKPAEVKTEVKADVITRAAARPVQRTTGATTPSKPPPPAETYGPVDTGIPYGPAPALPPGAPADTSGDWRAWMRKQNERAEAGRSRLAEAEAEEDGILKTAADYWLKDYRNVRAQREKDLRSLPAPTYRTVEEQRQYNEQNSTIGKDRARRHASPEAAALREAAARTTDPALALVEAMKRDPRLQNAPTVQELENAPRLTAKPVPRTNLVERAAAPPAPTVIDMSGDVVKENGKPMAPKGKSAKQKLLDAGVDPAYVNDPGFSEETAAQVALEMGLR